MNVYEGDNRDVDKVVVHDSSESYRDWISEITTKDSNFHSLLASYLLPLDLQQLVRLNHFWHDNIRYNVQRFFLSDEPYTWGKSFKELSDRALELIDDLPFLLPYVLIESENNPKEDEILEHAYAERDEHTVIEVNSKDTEEKSAFLHMRKELELNLTDEVLYQDNSTSDLVPQQEDPINDLIPEEADSFDYEEFLKDLDFIQGSSHRNICFDSFFFIPENQQYRQKFCHLLSDPSRQLCFYLRSTSMTNFARLGVKPWKVVYLINQLNLIHGAELSYFNQIDTVELHGDLTLRSLDGLSGIRVLRISNFVMLERIGGYLPSLEEIQISHCGNLQSLFGLESVTRARLEELQRLEDIRPIRNCEELYLSRSAVRSVTELNQLRFLTVYCCPSFLLEPDLKEMPSLRSLCVDISPHFPNFQISRQSILSSLQIR